MTKQKRRSSQHERGEGTERRPFAFKKYNAVVQSAELVDIRLVSSKFEVKPTYFSLRIIERDEKKTIMKLSMESNLTEVSYDREDGFVIGYFDWSASSSKGRTRVLNVLAKYLVVYTAAKDLDDFYVETFVDNVGRFATYPYFRSIVAAYSAASSAELPVLPVLKQPIRSVAEDELSRNATPDGASIPGGTGP